MFAFKEFDENVTKGENPDGDIVEGKVKVVRQLFPKPGQKIDNDNKILSVEPIKIEKGQVKLSSWNNFVIKGLAPKVDFSEEYTVTLKKSHDDKWGEQYEIVYMGTPMDLSGSRDQRIFLSKILTTTQVENLYKVLDDPLKAIEDENITLLTKCKGIGEIGRAHV